MTGPSAYQTGPYGADKGGSPLARMFHCRESILMMLAGGGMAYILITELKNLCTESY